MPKLVLLRHGQSQWNLQNRFTGWVDVDLSPLGEAEARRAGELIGEAQIELHRAFFSVLIRAIRTGCLALRACNQLWLPIEKSWRLNERHYGALTGLDKSQTAVLHGAAQVKQWRRSFAVAPPPLAPGGPFDFAADRRYAGITPPASESLEDTLARVLPYWDDAIAPSLARGETPLVAAHGNSLRAILKHLYRVSDETIADLEIPTGNPLVLELDGDLGPLGGRYLDGARTQPLPPP